MISLADFWMGRDVLYADELNDEIRWNAADTVAKINKALSLAAAEGVFPGIDPRTGTEVSSGWRPLAVNERTNNSASNSKHLVARACDIRDTKERSLARWAVVNGERLKAIGILGMERPAWTPTWVHLQTVPVASGHWCYIPSQHPALVEALPGETMA